MMGDLLLMIIHKVLQLKVGLREQVGFWRWHNDLKEVDDLEKGEMGMENLLMRIMILIQMKAKVKDEVEFCPRILIVRQVLLHKEVIKIQKILQKRSLRKV
jgi:hypothetical protein